MRKFEKLSRKYKYQMRQKYQEDPFAFLVLWSLFFSAIFLIFAFRGLIAATFMPKIDVSNELPQSEMTNAINDITNSTDNSANSATDAVSNKSVVNESANNQTNEMENTAE